MQTLLLIPAEQHRHSLLGDELCGGAMPIMWRQVGEKTQSYSWQEYSERSIMFHFDFYTYGLVLYRGAPITGGLARLGQSVLITGLGTPLRWNKLKFDSVYQWAKIAQEAGLGTIEIFNDADKT